MFKFKFRFKSKVKENHVELKYKIKSLEEELFNSNLECDKIKEKMEDLEYENKELETIICSIYSCSNCKKKNNKTLNKFVKKIELTNINRIDNICKLWKSISSVHNLYIN